MIEAVVSLNGEEFTVNAQSSVYDGERIDFTDAVAQALDAYALAYPLEPIDIVTLKVSVRRRHAERATHDGVGVEQARPPFVELPDPDDLDDDELDKLTDPDKE